MSGELEEIKKEFIYLESQIPTTRAGRIASILATIRAHPDGLNIQSSIIKFSHHFGMKRDTIIEYIKDLERLKLIKVTIKIYPCIGGE